MIESRGLSQILHLSIGISLLLIPISLYLGLRPICIVAGLGLGLFLLDYFLCPFKQFYETFTQWLPILFELNILNGIYILSKTIQLSTWLTAIFLLISLFRCLIIVYARLLPLDNQHRVYIENKFRSLSKFLWDESLKIYHRCVKCFFSSDDSVLEKFPLEPLNSDDPAQAEHDDTIHRFQKLVGEQDLSSPLISAIDSSNNATPPIRRHHQRILQQTDLEPLSRTPITPAHTNLTKGKILHSTMNGSYTGPITRNRVKTGPNTLPISPLTSKPMSDFTYLVSKRDEDHHIERC